MLSAGPELCGCMALCLVCGLAEAHNSVWLGEFSYSYVQLNLAGSVGLWCVSSAYAHVLGSGSTQSQDCICRKLAGVCLAG